MADRILKTATGFYVPAPCCLDAEDLKALTLLYQPLVGQSAISLYLTLNSLPSQKMAHLFLTQIFNVSLEEILQDFYKLESVGLVQTFEEGEDLFRYGVKKPLSPYKFLNDGVINAFLYLKLGRQEYQLLRKLFMVQPQAAPGRDISKSFNEVFDTAAISRMGPALEVVQLPGGTQEGIELDIAFDPDLLKAILKQRSIRESILTDKVLLELNKVAFLYKLDEYDLARMIFEALDPNDCLQLDTFRKQAKAHFNFLNQGQPVEISQLKPIEGEKAEEKGCSLSKEERLAHHYSQNPLDFLRFKSNFKDPVPADRDIVEWLFTEQQMPAAVVNVLIDFVLKISHGRLPKQLVEKVAGEWQRANIDSLDKAFAHVRKQLESKKKRDADSKRPAAEKNFRRPGRVIRQEAVPDWLDHAPLPQEQEDLTPEDLKQIERQNKILKDLGVM